jgi:hypothetical protein
MLLGRNTAKTGFSGAVTLDIAICAIICIQKPHSWRSNTGILNRLSYKSPRIKHQDRGWLPPNFFPDIEVT